MKTIDETNRIKETAARYFVAMIWIAAVVASVLAQTNN